MAPKDRSELGHLRTERVLVAQLSAAAYNPRKIGESQRAALAASLDRFGLVQPIVVNQRTSGKGWPSGSFETVVGGHQRLEVLRAQGVLETDVVLVDLTAAEEKALNVALNSRGLQGEFTAGLAGLLEELKGELPELSSALGFPGLLVDAAKISAKAGGDLAAIVEPPSIAGEPRTALGDLWQLGPHRLLCGDARVRADVERVLEGARADLVNTDPAYGVSYEAPSGKHEAIAGDALTGDALLALLVPAFKNAAAVATDAAGWYVWHASSTRREFDHALAAAGLVELQYLVWAKPSLVLGHADYQWAHEPCYYAGRAGKTPAWYGGRDQLTVWRIAQRPSAAAQATVLGPGLVVTDGTGDEMFLAPRPPKGKKVRTVRLSAGEQVLVHADDRRSSVWEVGRDSQSEDHPTQKPVALAARALLNSSKEGDHVLDLFAGAGFTLLAAEQLRRVAHLVELDPKCCDRIVARWEALTGRKASRALPPKAKPGRKNP